MARALPLTQAELAQKADLTDHLSSLRVAADPRETVLPQIRRFLKYCQGHSAKSPADNQKSAG